MYNIQSVDGSFQVFIDTLNYYVETPFPMKMFRESTRKPWIRPGICIDIICQVKRIVSGCN